MIRVNAAGCNQAEGEDQGLQKEPFKADSGENESEQDCAKRLHGKITNGEGGLAFPATASQKQIGENRNIQVKRDGARATAATGAPEEAERRFFLHSVNQNIGEASESGACDSEQGDPKGPRQNRGEIHLYWFYFKRGALRLKICKFKQNR